MCRRSAREKQSALGPTPNKFAGNLPTERIMHAGRVRQSMKWLFVALLLVPLTDAVLLVFVADVLGWPATVLIVVLTALLGTLLVRAEGRHTLRRFATKVQTGQLPTDELIDGGLLIAAGAFLLTPGLVTDAFGFLLALPLTRYPIRKLLKRVLGNRLDKHTDGFVSGRVYTGGFPNAHQQNWQEARQPGWQQTDDEGDGGGFRTNGRDATGPNDPIDVDGYSVDDDSYTVGSDDDSYTIEFDDEDR